MEILKIARGYARTTYICRLAAGEHLMSEHELVTLADNRGDYDELYRCLEASHPGHFGGNVEIRRGRKDRKTYYARIAVYID